jgi:hypothetical protein
MVNDNYWLVVSTILKNDGVSERQLGLDEIPN